MLLEPAELGAPSANLVKKNRQQSNIETHVDSDSPSKTQQYDPLLMQDIQRIVLFLILTPNSHQLSPNWTRRITTERSYSIQSFKSQAKKQHRISLPYYYHLHSLSKIFSQGPTIGRIHPNSTTIDQINACETNPGRLNSQTWFLTPRSTSEPKIRTFRWLRIAGKNADMISFQGKRSHQLG